MASFTEHDLKNLFCDRNSWTLVWAWFLANSYPLEFLSFAILLKIIFIKKLSVKNRNFQRAFLHQALVYNICSFTKFYIFSTQIFVEQQPVTNLLCDDKISVGQFFFSDWVFILFLLSFSNIVPFISGKKTSSRILGKG